ncbi:MAG: leucine-rich repeat protein, partial [Clostridia bacterium]|nr:leucine-rich repeat protein [Clostridia bacterium]
RVDNYKYGGHLLGLSLDGKALPYALDVKLNRVQILPTGVDLSSGIEIPGFSNVLKTAKRAHLHTPQGRMISWDIAIDDHSEAVIVEANFSGDLRMHHAVTGPLFGEMTEAFLDEYLAGRFSRERCSAEYDFREFFDHVEIMRYGGWRSSVTVPSEINGKPVTVIGREAFKGCEFVRLVKLPGTVKHILWDAFDSCTGLKEIRAEGTFASIAERAFVGTKLTAEDKKALRAKIVQ